MEWGKVKTILITVLLAVDIFMIMSFSNMLREKRTIQREALETAVTEAENGGLTVSADDIPRGTDSIPTYEIPRDEDAEEKIALNLLGECTAEQTGAETTVYRSKLGEATFRSSGHFEIKIESGCPEPKNEAEAEKLAISTAEKAGVKVRGAYCTYKDGELTVHLKQSLGGIEIENSEILVAFRGDSAHITGRWVFGKALSTGEMPKEASELIFKLKNELNKQSLLPQEILSIKTGFVAGAATGGRIKLQPVWSISYDGGKEYFDVVRGVLVFPE